MGEAHGGGQVADGQFMVGEDGSVFEHYSQAGDAAVEDVLEGCL